MPLISCSHDGYSRLPSKPIHTRSWDMQGKTLVVEDSIKGKYSAAFARFHLHPQLNFRLNNKIKKGQILIRGEAFLNFTVEFGIPSLQNSQWNPRFGVSVPNKCLVIGLENGLSKVRFDW